jgi:light-regulated signal transduction histidine kinase (bacteriophytochrome)
MSPKVKKTAAGESGSGKPEEQRTAIEAQALLAGLTALSTRAGHDMVGPLNQAGSLLALFIKRHLDTTDPDASQLLEFLQASAARMEGVVEGVRKYMATLARAPVFAPVDLNEALACALERINREVVESGAAIVAERLPVVPADASLMATVFEHLIGNAIKFRAANKAPRIYVTAGSEGEMTALTIRDEGIGIDPEYCDAVFVPFRRLNGREYAGAGLGLALVKTLIEMQGGSVRIVPVAEGVEGSSVQLNLKRS